MKLSVDVKGLAEVAAAIEGLKPATAKRVLRKVATEALTPMRDKARALAPDDPRTGPPHDLKSSIEISPKQKSGRQLRFTEEGASSVTVFMGPTFEGYPQAIPQEFGTAHHPPKPYMRPAWDQHKHQALQHVATELGAEVQKAAQRQARRAAKRAV